MHGGLAGKRMYHGIRTALESDDSYANGVHMKTRRISIGDQEIWVLAADDASFELTLETVDGTLQVNQKPWAALEKTTLIPKQ